ncbi:MAG: porphobilinogen synthase [Chitinophagaceae bacterium]|nr:porphobilinogen synthase [Chitinophagaceae bacterium]
MENIKYPLTERRQRSSSAMRELSAGRHLSHRAFIQPLFVEENLLQPREVNGLDHVLVENENSILFSIEADIHRGINKFLLFPVPVTRAERPSDFSFAISIVKKIKEHFGDDIWLALDCCLCSYTTHGHCGILNDEGTGVLNNPSVEILSQYALQLALAGADCIAPSDMMDGRIAAIRNKLDAFSLDAVSILSYSAKFSSQWYGPFRDACHSSPNATGLRDRKTYQLPVSDAEAALSAAARDEQEGADMLMVKPAGHFTDIIYRLKQQTKKPVVAYHVSGEYATIELLAKQGLLQREQAHIEIWASLQRAGADSIISYAAREARQWIENRAY